MVNTLNPTPLPSFYLQNGGLWDVSRKPWEDGNHPEGPHTLQDLVL